jgi:general secretion pathway protein C
MSAMSAGLTLQPRHALLAAHIAVGVAAVLLVVVLAQAVVRVLAVVGAPPAVAPARSIAELTRDTGSPAATLVQWRLFGQAQPFVDPRQAVAPDTSLALTLYGIIAADDPRTGRAIIGGTDVPQASYAAGAELSPGVVVDSVYPDRVLLSRNGVLETLRLPRADGTPATGPGMPAAAGAPVATPGAAFAVPSGDSATAASMPSTPPPTYTQPLVSTGNFNWQAATDALGVDAQALAREVSVLPVIEGGNFVGVRLSTGRDVPLIAKLGLKPDDVVTAVNGIRLDSPARATQVAQSLSSASQASVVVRRDGKEQTLTVSLR